MAEYYERLKARMLIDPSLRHKVRQRMREASRRYHQRVKENPEKLQKLRERTHLAVKRRQQKLGSK